MRYLLLPLFVLALHLRAAAQGAEQWSGVAFEHEVSERFGYEFEGEYRRPFSDGNDGRYYLLAACNHQLTGVLDLTYGGRYEPPRGEAAADARLFADLNLKVPLGEGPFTLTGRLRNQYDFAPGRGLGGGRHRIRPRAGLRWQLTDRVYISGEVERRYDTAEGRWIRRRYTAGPGLELTPSITLDAFYRNQLDFGEGGQSTVHIVGLYASYVLPDRRDRDWPYRRPFGRQLLR